MKLLYQAWGANELYDWAVAVAIMGGVVLALVVLKYAAGRIVTAVAKRTATRIDDILAQAIGATRIWLLLPLAVYAGASALSLPRKLEHLVDIVVVVALMLQVALWINRFVRGWLELQIEKRRGVDGEGVTALTLVSFGARVLVWALALLLILDHLGFDITALVAGLGIGGVAVALAVQNILGDLFASLSIILDKPFIIGDFVVVGDLRGTVENIGIKTTRVRSLDGELIVFSNADLLKSRIRNFKRMQERRIAFSVGVTYQTPLEKLAGMPQILREAVERQDGTRFDRAHFKGYGDFALQFEIVYYVLSPDFNVYMDVQQAINVEIYRRFTEEGIEFAYPTQTVFVQGGAVPAAPPVAEQRHAG
ncbi:MAG: mechanosensitive ion channel protein MscS [Betaproteobacteria bacterium RIFCSPLOWO2_12_FULL_62_13]|nr:MAG: mechanosensitive ion channel protein MscS [Betaproteobacteria bacterium RIFCSPLOWO2_12_FULL_62_13]